MKIEKKVTTTESITMCDIAGCERESTPNTYDHGRCSICERDICSDHTEVYYNDYDYGADYCTECYDVYLPLRQVVEDNYYSELARIEKETREKVTGK